MFIIPLIFGHNIFSNLVFIIALILLFIGLGRTIQKQFNFKYTNTAISLPIGAISYFVITGLFYLPVLAIESQWSIIVYIEIFKNISIIIYVLTNYRAWSSKFNWSMSNVIHSLLIVSVTMISLIIFFIYVNYNTASPNTFSLFNGINNLNTIPDPSVHSIIRVFTTFPDCSNTSAAIKSLEAVEGQYYWIAIISNIQGISVVRTMHYIMPTIIILSTTTAIFSVTTEINRKWYEFTIATMLVLVFSLLYAIVGPYSKSLYLVFYLMLTCALLYDYNNQVKPNNKNVTALLLLTTYIMWISYWAIILIGVIGTSIVLYSIQKDTNINRNISTFIVMYVSELIFFSLLQLAPLFSSTNPDANPTFQLIYTAVIVFVGLTLIAGAYSMNITNRKQELFQYERGLVKNLGKIVIGGTLIIFLFSLLALVLPGFASFNDIWEYFYALWPNNRYVGLSIYFVFIMIPSLIVFIYVWITKSKTWLIMLPLFNIFVMNPMALTIVTSMTSLSIDRNILLLPNLVFVLFWSFGSLLKLAEKVFQ